jgi:ABC-type Fe3+-hydroxamate transport system substrate-binding protein
MPVDALGRDVVTHRPPTRVVSLVPSETESVLALVSPTRLVGRTDYCVEPARLTDAIPSVGGTKSVDVAAVIALAPDLVLANQEENARVPIEQLIDAGLPVHVSFPLTVDESVAYLDALAALLHVPADAPPLVAVREALIAVGGAREVEDALRVFVPIWKDPWMTFDGRTFASDVLRRVGALNVFADRARRYPLAADLGRAAPLPEAAVEDRDTRYPRVTLDEVRTRAPDLVLLPDEPYAFTKDHQGALAAELPEANVRLVDGKDLFWYGIRTAGALSRLRQMLDNGEYEPL